MAVLTGLYTHRELRLIYSAKGDVLTSMAAIAEENLISNRVPAWLRASAAEWYAKAAQESEQEAAVKTS